MKNLIAGIAVILALTTATTSAQSPPPSPQFELPKIEEARIIGLKYRNDGFGKILAADKSGKVQQYMDVWADQSKAPIMITYVIVGTDGQTFTATWGRGPVDPAAFTCQASSVPEFGKKSLWVAIVSNGVLTFQEIENGDVKGLFDNLTIARQEWSQTIGSAHQRYYANLTQENVLGFMKEKNRKKWVEQGWLRPLNPCTQLL